MSKADRDKLALLRELSPAYAAAEKFRLLRELHPEFDRRLERQPMIDFFEEMGWSGVLVRNAGDVRTSIGVEQTTKSSGINVRHASTASVENNAEGAEAVTTEIAVESSHHHSVPKPELSGAPPLVNEARPHLKKPRFNLTPDEQAELVRGQTAVTYQTAAKVLGVTIRWIRKLAAERKLKTRGEGHNKKIDVASLRSRAGLPSTNSEQNGTQRK